MTDEKILELFFLRSELAIQESQLAYGSLLYHISYNILHCREDTEECVNDTYLAAWNNIPPTRPHHLSTYLGKITRHLSIDRWRRTQAAKRGGGQFSLIVDELNFHLPAPETPEDAYLGKELEASILQFVRGLSDSERRIFLCRYWYMESIGEIAQRFGFTQGKVKTTLSRTRQKLKKHLETEGGYTL